MAGFIFFIILFFRRVRREKQFPTVTVIEL